MTDTITVFLPKSQWTEENGGYDKLTPDEFKKTIRIGSIFNGHVYFDWSGANGFGQLSFYVDPDTHIIGIGNEGMGKEACRQLLYAFVDKVIDEGDFNEWMNECDMQNPNQLLKDLVDALVDV